MAATELASVDGRISPTTAATIPLPVYPVKVEGDDILIEVEE